MSAKLVNHLCQHASEIFECVSSCHETYVSFTCAIFIRNRDIEKIKVIRVYA